MQERALRSFRRVEAAPPGLRPALRGDLQPADEYPAVNLQNNGEGALAVVELPGFAPGNTAVSVVQYVLTLRGECSAPKPKEGETYHRREHWQGNFTRSLALPFEAI